jgi:hypothetical protein
MSLQSILDAVGELDRAVTELPSGLPSGDRKVRDVLARLDALDGELRQEQGLSAPLVPDAKRPTSAAEATARDLERALRSLRDAVTSKST